MIQIFTKFQDLFPAFSETQRRKKVQEIADSIIDTLLLSKTDGKSLSATELASVVLKINSSVFIFLDKKKNDAEQNLQDINKAIDELKKVC
jgi:hypothetical protein